MVPVLPLVVTVTTAPSVGLLDVVTTEVTLLADAAVVSTTVTENDCEPSRFDDGGPEYRFTEKLCAVAILHLPAWNDEQSTST